MRTIPPYKNELDMTLYKQSNLEQLGYAAVTLVSLLMLKNDMKADK